MKRSLSLFLSICLLTSLPAVSVTAQTNQTISAQAVTGEISSPKSYPTATYDGKMGTSPNTVFLLPDKEFLRELSRYGDDRQVIMYYGNKYHMSNDVEFWRLVSDPVEISEDYYKKYLKEHKNTSLTSYEEYKKQLCAILGYTPKNEPLYGSIFYNVEVKIYMPDGTPAFYPKEREKYAAEYPKLQRDGFDLALKWLYDSGQYQKYLGKGPNVFQIYFNHDYKRDLYYLAIYEGDIKSIPDSYDSKTTLLKRAAYKNEGSEYIEQKGAFLDGVFVDDSITKLELGVDEDARYNARYNSMELFGDGIDVTTANTAYIEDIKDIEKALPKLDNITEINIPYKSLTSDLVKAFTKMKGLKKLNVYHINGLKDTIVPDYSILSPLQIDTLSISGTGKGVEKLAGAKKIELSISASMGLVKNDKVYINDGNIIRVVETDQTMPKDGKVYINEAEINSMLQANNVTSLSIYGNAADHYISRIGKMSSLRTLAFSYESSECEKLDISKWKKLKKLRTLNIKTYGDITGFDAISSFPIEDLELSLYAESGSDKDRFADIASISKLSKLKKLAIAFVFPQKLTNTFSKKLSFLKDMDTVEELELYGLSCDPMGYISGMKKLRKLSFFEQCVPINLSKLSKMKTEYLCLQSFYCDQSLSGIEKANALKEVRINGDSFSDYKVLSSMNILEKLCLYYSEDKHFSAKELSGVKAKELRIYMYIYDSMALANMPQLEKLYIYYIDGEQWSKGDQLAKLKKKLPHCTIFFPDNDNVDTDELLKAQKQ